MLKISYLGRLKSTSITPYEPFSWKSYPRPPLWHLRIPSRARQRQIELAPDCSTLPRTIANLLPTLRTVTRPPLASANTPTNPPGEYRAGTSLPPTSVNDYGSVTHFTYRHKETRTPSGIYKYPHEPARGTRASN
jgi:hypothetical protein